MKRVLASLLVSLFCFSLVLVPASADSEVPPLSSSQYHGFVYVAYGLSPTDYIVSPGTGPGQIISTDSGSFPRNEITNSNVLHCWRTGSGSAGDVYRPSSWQFAIFPDVAISGGSSFGVLTQFFSGTTDSGDISDFTSAKLSINNLRGIFGSYAGSVDYTVNSFVSERGVSSIDFSYTDSSGNKRSDTGYPSMSSRYILHCSVPSGRDLTAFIVVLNNSPFYLYGSANAMIFDVPVLCIYPLTGVSSIDEYISSILDHVISIDNAVADNLPNIAQGIINIYNQLKDMGLQLDDIKSVLNIISGLNQSQLEQLQKISSSVDAIYYFLTEALKSESDKVNETTQGAIQDIDNSHQAEDYWQSSMQGNYDSLDLEGFTFGGLTGPLTLVGTIFSDMWTAFGSYSIIFTFPLILGIALLVIGRIGKSGGGGSSRKGGKGGTDDA